MTAEGEVLGPRLMPMATRGPGMLLFHLNIPAGGIRIIGPRGGRAGSTKDQNASASSSITVAAPDWMRARCVAVIGS